MLNPSNLTWEIERADSKLCIVRFVVESLSLIDVGRMIRIMRSVSRANGSRVECYKIAIRVGDKLSFMHLPSAVLMLCQLSKLCAEWNTAIDSVLSVPGIDFINPIDDSLAYAIND